MKTILLVDDDANLRTLVRATLKDREHRILEAADGKTGLELARKERPDLIVLDWMMPVLTGIEVIKALHEDPLTAEIPVILLTAQAQEDDVKCGLSEGAHAYLIKPFSPLELLEKVEEVLA